MFSVPFQHAFQNDTLGPVGNNLGAGTTFTPFFFSVALYRALS